MNANKFLGALNLVFALAGLTACADIGGPRPAMLTYETKPEGAVIYESGQSLGVAPVTRSYVGDPASPIVRTPDVVAVWPSGAKTSFWTELKRGADNVAVLERPASVPGLAQDEANGKKVAAERAADAARNKDSTARDIKRNSERCKVQMQTGNLATNDC